MALFYTYPTDIELREIEQDLLPVLTNNDPIFQDFPIVNRDSNVVAWEAYDSFTGLQSVRGLNGDPTRVRAVGAKRFVMEPGVYGEFATIDEKVLTEGRPIGTLSGKIDLTTEVRRKQDQLLTREISRIRWIIWTLLSTGVFSVLDQAGQIVHTDRYTMQTANAAVAWSNSAQATPLADFRAIKLLARGHSVSFGARAKAYMNQSVFNEMVTNTNPNDLAGRRVTGLLSPLNLEEINRILLAEDLPQIIINDDGYIDDAGVFQLYCPNDTVVVVGKRTNGAPLGEYQMTRNANNPNGEPGPYVKVVDSANSQTQPVPRTIQVHRGHNGGPALFHPNAVVRLAV